MALVIPDSTVKLTPFPIQCRFGESDLLKKAQYVTMMWFENVSGIFGDVTTMTLALLSTAIPMMTTINLMPTKSGRLPQSKCWLLSICRLRGRMERRPLQGGSSFEILTWSNTHVRCVWVLNFDFWTQRWISNCQSLNIRSHRIKNWFNQLVLWDVVM